MMSPHIHSVYSLLDGTIRGEEIIAAAKGGGSSYAVMTDTNGMYGLIQFARMAQQENIKPVLGAVIDAPEKSDEYVVLIAKNIEGYSRLCQIITTRKLKEDFRLDDIFKENLENLFIITPSIELLKRLRITGPLKENLFAELIITKKKKRKTRELYEYAGGRNIKIVASHPAYFPGKDDFLLHKVVRAISENSTLANLDESLLADEEYYLKTPEEFRSMWKAVPEALWNLEKIMKEANVDLGLGQYKFPVFPLPPGETAFSYLWKISFRGLEEKYTPITEKAVKRLQYELEVIDELGFCDYFLIVWDIVREAGARGMMNIGRGSAANSLVAYCLGLSQVDPLEHNLYFERFLNRGRTSPPDVDLDFSWKERDEIVKYVYDKYGYDRVAMISTIVTFRARSAFRETAKVFGIPEGEISRYSKFIPWTSAKNLKEIAHKFPESKNLKFDAEPWKSIVDIATRLAGFPRHLSIHPGGIVITENQITNYIALEYAKNKGLGLIVTQPDMYPVEDLGLIKIDLLSQRSLGVLRDTLSSIKVDTPPAPSDTKIFSITGKVKN